MFFFAALVLACLSTYIAIDVLHSNVVRKDRIEMAKLRGELKEAEIERDRLAAALAETETERDHVKVRAKVLTTIVDHYYKKPAQQVYYTETCSRPRVTDPTWYGDDKGTVAD